MAIDAEVSIGLNTTALQAGAARAQRIVSGLSSGITGTLAKAGAAVAAFGAASFAKDFISDSLRLAAEFENLKSGLGAVMGGAQAAESEIAKLEALAKKPGLTFESVIGASRSFQAAGFEADKARQIIEQLGNVLAIEGGSSQDLDDIAAALRRIHTEGSIMDTDIEILTGRSGLLAQALLKAFGSTTAQGIRDAGHEAKDFVENLLGVLSVIDRAQITTSTQIKNTQQEIAKLKREIGTVSQPAQVEFLKMTKGAAAVASTLAQMFDGVPYAEIMAKNRGMNAEIKKTGDSWEEVTVKAQAYAASLEKSLGIQTKLAAEAFKQFSGRLNAREGLADEIADAGGDRTKLKRTQEKIQMYQDAIDRRSPEDVLGDPTSSEDLIKNATTLVKLLKEEKSIREAIDRETMARIERNNKAGEDKLNVPPLAAPILPDGGKASRYDENGRRADGRRQIKGFSPAQHENQPIANPYRGLDSMKAQVPSTWENLQRGQSKFDQLQNKPKPIDLLKAGAPLDSKAAANATEKPVAKTDIGSLLGKAVEYLQVVSEAVK